MILQMRTEGIHHITAIVGNPQENVDFYAGILGLRMVKKTVNFDDPGTYHLYFGNEEGSPGTIMTFFPWPNAYKGQAGSGQVGITSFSVPVGSMPFWEDRLEKFHVNSEHITRFGEDYLVFEDPHGLQLELVEREDGQTSRWSYGGVPAEFAIKGFGGAVLLSGNPKATEDVLSQVLGLTKIGEDGEFARFKARGNLGNIIDVKLTSLSPGSIGVGTVHHIAWRAEDFEDHEKWREYVQQAGYGVTPIRDRQYFNAIYFRERGGILFEIATDPPGFTRDETADKMGSSLLLPPWLEPRRQEIQSRLLPAEARVLKEDTL
ncbi:ring-cleaving dioxygenase [Peribacillus sp. SCS-155]|uniref:ring-cleaving dioxygenase n=1 Tax=Peribacillus sedimenti TaxID=3115297 RepID=UPI0039068FB3